MNDQIMSFNAGIIAENYLWCINNCDGGLYRVDTQGFKIELVAAVTDFKNDFLPYIKATIYKNKVYFFPLFSNGKIILCDIYRNEIEKLPLMDLEKKILYSVSINKSRVLFFPRNSKDKIVYFDMERNKTSYYTNIKLGYHINSVVVNEKNWIPIFNTNKLIEFDTETGTSKTHYISHYKLGAVAFDGELFWLSAANQYKVISWNYKTGEINEYKRKGTSEKNNVYVTIICANNKIFLLPGYGRNIEMVDKELGVIKKTFNMPEDFCLLPDRWGHAFLEYYLLGDEIWIYPAMGNMLLIIDTLSLDICGYTLLVPSLELLYKKYFIDRSLIYSEENFGLVDYNKFLESADLFHVHKKNIISINYGSIIYQYIKKI